jgi:hypothetical protein
MINKVPTFSQKKNTKIIGCASNILSVGVGTHKTSSSHGTTENIVFVRKHEKIGSQEQRKCWQLKSKNITHNEKEN